MATGRKFERGKASSLVVGDRIVSRCDDGLLVAECVLFEPSDTMRLPPADGAEPPERGYLTTAGFARSRLEEAGLSVNLAQAAFEAIHPDLLGALATCPAVLRVIGELGPCEAFEGGAYTAASGLYEGTWLDLGALAGALSSHVSVLLQALHLLLVVDELPESLPVRLLTPTDQDGAQRARLVDEEPLRAAGDLPLLLRALPTVPLHPHARDEAEVRESLLRNLQARAAASERSRARLHTLASHLAGMGKSPRPDPPDAAQAPGETGQFAAPLRPSERVLRDDTARIFEEVRRRSLELQGDYSIRTVAEFLSSKANLPAAPSEITVLAARAWLAAGEEGHARHFAKKLVENPHATDDTRLMALEILEGTSPTNESLPPPPETTIEPTPIVVISGGPELNLEPPPVPGQPQPFRALTTSPAPIPSATSTSSPPAEREASPPQAIVPDQPLTVRLAPAKYARPEVVETMQLPPGAEERMLPPGTWPADALQVRIAMTRLARDVGRDYRLWYGTALKTDTLAIDAMQRHLRRRFPSEVVDEKVARQLEKELLRHGAVLSEILARRLGAEWADVSADQPAHWAMMVPPGARVWPLSRVYRFFSHGHHDSDLVAFYLDLENHAKGK